jgi:hypothetical protein
LTLSRRLAFFAISNNIVVIALRGMIVEFAFFMGVAAICFSGLLFTLWRLGEYAVMFLFDVTYTHGSLSLSLSLSANGSWPVKSIMWLMVQIWFGNTYLSKWACIHTPPRRILNILIVRLSTGGEFPPCIWTDPYDALCGTKQYTAVDEYVKTVVW